MEFGIITSNQYLDVKEVVKKIQNCNTTVEENNQSSYDYLQHYKQNKGSHFRISQKQFSESYCHELSLRHRERTFTKNTPFLITRNTSSEKPPNSRRSIIQKPKVQKTRNEVNEMKVKAGIYLGDSFRQRTKSVAIKKSGSPKKRNQSVFAPNLYKKNYRATTPSVQEPSLPQIIFLNFSEKSKQPTKPRFSIKNRRFRKLKQDADTNADL